MTEVNCNSIQNIAPCQWLLTNSSSLTLAPPHRMTESLPQNLVLWMLFVFQSFHEVQLTIKVI